MAVEKREYLLSYDTFNQPAVVEGTLAEAFLLARLILLEPGSDPLHPEMGVGIKSNFRYTVDTLDELRDRINDQKSTYLPEFSNDLAVELILTPDKVLNIEISAPTGEVYVFKTEVDEINPYATLSDIENN